MKILKVKWGKLFKFAIQNVSAIDELIDLIEECKNAVADGKISNDERSRLMQRYWNLVKALKEAQNRPK
jgi:tellurite resistance protein